jgi:Ca2+-binding RTX toxin-like protein
MARAAVAPPVPIPVVEPHPEDTPMPLTPATWREQFTVNATIANAQFDPDIIQLANGNLLVSWTTSDPGGLGSPNGNETFAQIFDPRGNRIGGEIRLNNASTAGDEQNADLAPLPDGGFIVVYHDLDNPGTSPAGGSNIRLEEYDAAGNQVAENALVVLDSGDGSDPNYRNPRVAVSNATSALIVYEEYTASGTKIAGRIYNPAADSYGSQLTLINASGLVDATPDVAVLSNGNYVIATTYKFGTDNAINYTIISNAGGGVKGPTFVANTSTNGLNDREATVTALAGGGFVIAWTNTDANDTDILFRVFDNAGTEIGQGSAGDDSASNNNNESKVIALATGGFVIAWDNDSVIGVNVQHFGAAGTILGSVFTVAADNANNIAGVGLGDGRVALVWDSSGIENYMEILDTRDAPNEPGVYAPDQWQVGTAASDTFTVGAAVKNAAGGLGNDTINGNANANTLFGDDGNDTLNGVAGNDTVDGGSGNDSMAGGTQNDTYFVDSVSDTVTELVNQGYDAVNTTTASYTLGTHVERVNSTSGLNFVGTGNALDNRFQSLGGDDRFVDVLGGADIFSGGAGTDTVDFRSAVSGAVLDFISNVHSGAAAGDSYSSIEKFLGSNTAGDTMTGGGTGRWVFVGGGGNDTLTGGVKNDQLIGQAGNDTLSGGADRDSLQGGLGNDTMTGGTQGDVFVYSDLDADFGDDLITDFQDGIDEFKVHSNIADDVTDFAISGNGTTNVLLTLIADPAHSIRVQGAAAITISNDDFAFY